MHNERKLIDGLYYVGASDRRLTKFENLLPLERGVSYNSYLFIEEKTCLFDTVDISVTRQFLDNIDFLLKDRKLDYLVISHMEPDHCYNIREVLLRHPETVVVGNAKTFSFLKQFFPDLDLEGHTLVVKEGDTLAFGKRVFHFVMTPMVHWPEVMMTYEEKDGLLFSADAFGTFKSLDGNMFADQVDYDRDWLDESRRYYTNIVGKYGMQVQMAFKKLSSLNIKMILPLHGPVYRNDIAYILDKYQKWSTYEPEKKGVIIIYGSMYGDNENAAEILASSLSEDGVMDIRVYDASMVDPSFLVSESFRVSNIVLIAPTYNMTIYPAIDVYLDDMLRMGLKNRTFSLIQNGSWCPASLGLMKKKLSLTPSFKFTATEVTVFSSVNEKTREDLKKVAKEIVQSL